MTQSIPHINPADQSSPEGVLNHILRQFGMRLAVRLPAVVQSYDRANNLVTVQPSPALENSMGVKVPRAPLTMTVLTLAGGGFFFNFPLKPGDTGHVAAFDRDISLFRQSLSPSAANTNRIHAWEDSVFIPDKFRDFTVGGDDQDAVVLQSLDGATKISVKHGTVDITAATVKINATTIEMNASSNIDFNTPRATFNAVVQMPQPQMGTTPTDIGGGRSSINLSTTGDIISGGISLQSHVHTGVESGGGNTGGPQ